MTRDFNARDNGSRSGKSRSPESEDYKKNSREETEESKLFAAKNPLNPKRPKRPRTTRVRPGEPRPFDAANHSKPSTERSDRPYHDKSNFSFGDLGRNSYNREEKPWGARKPFNPKPGGDRRNSSYGKRSNDFNSGNDTRRSGNYNKPQRDSNSFNYNRNSDDKRPYQKSGYNRDRITNSENLYNGDGSGITHERNYNRDGNRPPRDNRFKKEGSRTPYESRQNYDGKRNSGRNTRDNSSSDRRFSRSNSNSGFRNDRTKPPYKKVLKPKKDVQPEPVKREFNEAGEMRLNRYLAHAGISSRRQADDYIKAGLVTVNGVVITEMGVKIKRGDDVRYNGERIGTERKVYILVNKPKGYVTTNDDEMGRKTILDLVTDACPERVYPVGRLDRNTTGVILLTNDGDLAEKLTHPKYNKKKIYHVVLDKNLKTTDLQQITDGITLDDGFIQPDAVSIVSPEKKNEVGIEIHSGRNRIVRRIFEQLGYEIVRLDRVYFAGLTKKNLARGKWRFLSDPEVNMLQMNSFE